MTRMLIIQCHTCTRKVAARSIFFLLYNKLWIFDTQISSMNLLLSSKLRQKLEWAFGINCFLFLMVLTVHPWCNGQFLLEFSLSYPYNRHGYGGVKCDWWTLTCQRLNHIRTNEHNSWVHPAFVSVYPQFFSAIQSTIILQIMQRRGQVIEIGTSGARRPLLESGLVRSQSARMKSSG